MITKNQLIHMLGALGRTLSEAATPHPPIRTKKSLVDRGFLEVTTRKVFRHSSRRIIVTYLLTNKGKKYLGLWTIQELSHIILSQAQNFSANVAATHGLFYLITVMPLEMLPEFLSSPFPGIALAAKTRQEELTNEND